MVKKVLLTGGSGLIGKEVIPILLDAGFEVYAISSKEQASSDDINWIKADLFDTSSIKRLMSEIKPSYLLHFAWCASGDYLTSENNNKFLKASLNMLKFFKENGGNRVVMAGTCFEYEFKDEPLKECDDLNPITLYAKCKVELCEKAMAYCIDNDLSFGWGRIFYVYGHNENEKRLTPHVINSLKDDKGVTIGAGPLIKDYMYTKDIAGAFVKFLDSDCCGVANIATGEGISIREYTQIIAKKLKKADLLSFKDNCEGQPKVIVGDNSRLKNEIGYEIQYSVDDAIDNILNDKKMERV